MLQTLRSEVVRYAQKMVESGLVRANQGNISIRDTETGLICITPSGYDYDRMTASDVVVVDPDGTVIEGEQRPSSELPLHTLILRRRPDVNCVMHTHSLYATAFGVIHKPLPIVLAESALCLGGVVPVAPYQMSGTPEFAEVIAETLGDNSAVIWGNHGAMVVAPTLSLAFSAAHALEDGARVYALAAQIGTPIELKAEEIDKLHVFWQQHFGQK